MQTLFPQQSSIKQSDEQVEHSLSSSQTVSPQSSNVIAHSSSQHSVVSAAGIIVPEQVSLEEHSNPSKSEHVSFTDVQLTEQHLLVSDDANHEPGQF